MRVASRRQSLFVVGVRFGYAMSNVCPFCQTKESASASKWIVRGDCAGRRDPPSAVRDLCADNGFASSSGTWPPNAMAPFRRNICRALGAAEYSETVAGEFRDWCDPSSICRDMFAACPWIVELRRAPPAVERGRT